MPPKSAAKTPKSPTPKRSTTKAIAKPAAAPKRSKTKAAIKKPVAAAKSVTPIKVVTTDANKSDATEINKRELVERVAAQSGMKKGEARKAVDAVLGAIGKTISDGKGIAAAPLGKMKLVRKKQTPNGELAVLRVKLKDPNRIAQNAAAEGVSKAQK